MPVKRSDDMMNTQLRTPSRKEGVLLIALVAGALLYSAIAPKDRLTLRRSVRCEQVGRMTSP